MFCIHLCSGWHQSSSCVNTFVSCGKQFGRCSRVFRYSTGKVQAPLIKPSLKKPKTVGIAGWLLLSVPVAAFGLGTWQIERKKWKEDLIHKLMIKTKEPPVPLPESEEELKDLEYRRVVVTGEFDHSKEIYLGPRSCLVEGESKKNQGTLISSSSGVSGYYVITPFVLSDTGERILVNRGWVPFDKKNPKTRQEGQIDGEIELVGVIRLNEPRPQFTAHNKPDVKTWFSRDLNTMAEFLDTSKIFLDASYESTVPGGPIGGQTRAGLRNEHLSYIITWYSLSAATAILWYFRYFK